MCHSIFYYLCKGYLNGFTHVCCAFCGMVYLHHAIVCFLIFNILYVRYLVWNPNCKFSTVYVPHAIACLYKNILIWKTMLCYFLLFLVGSVSGASMLLVILFIITPLIKRVILKGTGTDSLSLLAAEEQMMWKVSTSKF